MPGREGRLGQPTGCSAARIACEPAGYWRRGNILDLITPILARRKMREVGRQPKPYLMLRCRLIEEASAKYLVGQLTSAIVKPCQKICANIWLSKTKSSELSVREIRSRTSREKARYPVWYSESFAPRNIFSAA